MVQDEAAVPLPVFADIDQMESALSVLAPDGDMCVGITRRLRAILSRWIEAQRAAESEDADMEFESTAPDGLLDFLGKEIGSL